MNKIIMHTMFSFLLLGSLKAQESVVIPNEIITLQKALSIALERNHDITITNRTVEISKNNAAIGNAGLLPSVSASGSYSDSINDTEFQVDGQPKRTISGAGSNTLSGSLSASYLLFDGFGNYYRFQSLNKLEEQAGVQARLQIEGTLLQVISFYLSAVNQQQSLEINKEALSQSQERYSRVAKKYELGNATRLDLLSAQVDLNSDSVAYVQAQNLLQNSKRDLLIQLGAEPDSEIEINSEILIDPELMLDELIATSSTNNAALVLSKLTAENALLGIKQNKSSRFPKISLSGSYDYFRNESDAGQLLFQKSTGFTGGISISLNLFNGFKQETSIQNAQIELKNSEETLFLTQKTLKRDVMNTYENYQTNLFLLQKQEVNLETAELNFDRSKQFFELGQITNTQFREAQLNVLNVQLAMLNLRIQAKLSEVSLYQLSGRLIGLSSE